MIIYIIEKTILDFELYSNLKFPYLTFVFSFNLLKNDRE